MSSLNRDEMIKNLNEIVVPSLRQLNFKGSFPHFRRLTADRINLLTFQFDRNGGGFVIEIANCNSTGYKTVLDRPIPPNKLTAHDFNTRKRIQSNMKTPDSSTDDWFRYDKKHLFGLGDIYKKVCKDVLSKLDIAEDYWKNGELN
ncbi:MAG: DUF4304 domain-containing protein [Flavobacterium sp.]